MLKRQVILHNIALLHNGTDLHLYDNSCVEKIETQLKTNRLTKQTILCGVRRSAALWRAVLRGRLRPQ